MVLTLRPLWGSLLHLSCEDSCGQWVPATGVPSGFPLLVQGDGHQRWQKGAHLCRQEPTAGQALPVTLLQVFREAGGSRRPQVLCCLPQNPFHCSAVTRNS